MEPEVSRCKYVFKNDTEILRKIAGFGPSNVTTTHPPRSLLPAFQSASLPCRMEIIEAKSRE